MKKWNRKTRITDDMDRKGNAMGGRTDIMENGKYAAQKETKKPCKRVPAGRYILAAAILAAVTGMAGCGNAQTGNVEPASETGMTAGNVADGSAGDAAGNMASDDGTGNIVTGSLAEGTATGDGVENMGVGSAADTSVIGSGIKNESAEDASVDFTALQGENPEIFAWLYIPGTGIDVPVLQSMQGDDYYQTHDASGREDADGAVYIELANLADMCDFNTVLHGGTGTGETGPFAGLYDFANPDFFEEHEQMYLYLDGNVLTYEIFAAYEREDTSLLREYDFTYLAGCQQFLNDLYGIRDLSMNLREGWEGLTPYQFLITLTTQKNETDDRQMVVIGVLTGDAAGTVSRVVAE